MKSIQVTRVTEGEMVTLKNVSLLLENLSEIHKIECLNWKEFPGKPKVEFRIGHSGDRLFLKFYVTENSVRALETAINGDVYKDSCVEFFLSADGANYYNFEFSCIGTPHVAWGCGRHNRLKISPEVISKLQIKSSLGIEPFDSRSGVYVWELVVIIPASCMVHDPGLTFTGLSATANFYKCGDNLPEPHFLTWNPVKTPNPDFHQISHFGKIDFE